MFCSNCGKKIDSKAKYCSSCGHELKTHQTNRIDPPEKHSPESHNKNQQKKEDITLTPSEELEKKTLEEKISTDSIENKSFKPKSKEKKKDVGKTCPKCGLLNPETSETCDCGYSFKKGIVETKPSKEADKNSTGKKKRLIRPVFIYIFFILFLIGGLASLIIPELAGSAVDSKQWFYFSVWFGIFAAYFAKQRGKSGLLGFIVGFILAVGISIISLTGIEVFKRNKEATAIKETKAYYPSGKLQSEGNVVDGKMEGIAKGYYENGKLKVESNFKNGKKDGIAKWYHENGNLKYVLNFKNDKMISKEFYDESGNRIGESKQRGEVETNDSDIETVSLDSSEAKHEPYFSDVKNKIESTWSYPQEAAEKEQSGQLMLQFIVDRDGKLLDTSIINSSGYKILDQAALNSIKMASPYPPFTERINKKKLRIIASFKYKPFNAD